MRCHRGLNLRRLRRYVRRLHRDPGEVGMRRMPGVRACRMSHRHQALLQEPMRLRHRMSVSNGGLPREPDVWLPGFLSVGLRHFTAANHRRLLNASGSISLREQWPIPRGGDASGPTALLIEHVLDRGVRMLSDLSHRERALRPLLVYALTGEVRGGHVPCLDRGRRQEKRCVAHLILGSVDRRGLGGTRRRSNLARKKRDNGPRLGLLTSMQGPKPGRINLGTLSTWPSKSLTPARIRRRTWTAPTMMAVA